LVQMRQSRSVYLGRRFGTVYPTLVADPEVAEQRVLQVVESLSHDGQSMRVADALGREHEFANDHPLSRAAAQVAKALKERGLDPLNLDGTGFDRLCFIDQDNKHHIPADITPARAMPSIPVDESNRSDGAPLDEEADIHAMNESELGHESSLDEEAAPPSPPPESESTIDAAAIAFHQPVSKTPEQHLLFAAERLADAQINSIHRALRVIAGMDDGAVTKDGTGFNKHDTEIGKSLANEPQLTPIQAALGRMLVLYYGKRQLAESMPALRAQLSHASLKMQPKIRDIKLPTPTAPAGGPQISSQPVGVAGLGGQTASPVTPVLEEERSSNAIGKDSGQLSAPAPTLTSHDAKQSAEAPQSRKRPPQEGMSLSIDAQGRCRLGGRIISISPVQKAALSAFAKQSKRGMRALSYRNGSGKVVHVDKVLVGGTVVDLNAEVGVAIAESQVPSGPSAAPGEREVHTLVETVESVTASASVHQTVQKAPDIPPSTPTSGSLDADSTQKSAQPSPSPAGSPKPDPSNPAPESLPDGTIKPTLPDAFRRALLPPNRQSPDVDIA
jgi:hypothetical protein